MTGITFPKDQIFRDWREGESSRIVDETFYYHEERQRVLEFQKRIAQHHTSDIQEHYFYSVRKICLSGIDRANRESQKTRELRLILLACIGVSVIVYLMTRPYFENAWKVCKAIADKSEYVMKRMRTSDGYIIKQLVEKASNQIDFYRIATVVDIWRWHPTAGVSGWEFLRNAFCFLFPIAGSSVISKVTGLGINEKTDGPAHYNLIIERSKDDRVCPPNFDIQKDCDPFTQEEISPQKLRSPQMIYLPNYVTEAKSFVLALLTANKKDFSDPYSRRKFTEEERKQILSQIERIFMISEANFNKGFENSASFYDGVVVDNVNHFINYIADKRVFNERGQLSDAAERHLQDVQDMFGDIQDFNARVDRMVQPIHDVQQREMARGVCRRAVYMPVLESSGYIDSLKEDDKTSWRIHDFENKSGVSLRDPSATNNG